MDKEFKIKVEINKGYGNDLADKISEELLEFETALNTKYMGKARFHLE